MAKPSRSDPTPSTELARFTDRESFRAQIVEILGTRPFVRYELSKLRRIAVQAAKVHVVLVSALHAPHRDVAIEHQHVAEP